MNTAVCGSAAYLLVHDFMHVMYTFIMLSTIRFCSTPDPWLVTTNLRKIEGAWLFFVRLLAFWIVCVTVLVKNATVCTFKAISCNSSAYTMHPLLLYISIVFYNRIQVVHGTVKDVIKPCKLHKYMYSEGHNAKYKLYVRLNQTKGNEYALSLLS